MYGTIIINNTIQNSISQLRDYKDKLVDSGNLFVVVKSESDTIGDISNDFLDIISAADSMGYLYVNTIVVPAEIPACSYLPDNVLYIVWLAKTKNHFFNKDVIRESHIWKDVEWGKRAKNYNPKGKDPGNVWIPTRDDGKANITEHISLTLSSIINRLFNSTNQDGLDTLFVTSTETNNLTLDSKIIIVNTDKKQPNIPNKIAYKNPVSRTLGDITGTVVWGSSEKMDTIPNESVNVVITSPPYWDLKDYYKEGQIGQESYEIYLERLYTVWKECYNKLIPNGSLWININIRTKNGKVILIPKEFVKQCKAIGFHYKGILIWHKSSGIPTHEKNIVDRHEYVLIFSKSKDLNINSKLLEFADYKNDKINGGLFWNINRKAGSVGKHFIHPAIYPNELVSRIVQITTNRNDTVLDPFLGSGTTLIASVLEGRNCIGYEFNEGFKELIIDRYNNEVRNKCFHLII